MKKNGKGMIHLNDSIHQQFADSLLSLAPDIPMDKNEIVQRFQSNGFSGVITIINGYDPEIFEVTELLTRLGRGGAPHGKG